MSESTDTTNGCRRCQEQLLSVKETSALLGIAEKSIRNRLSLGTFPLKAYRFGGRVLFKLSELIEFIENLPEVEN